MNNFSVIGIGKTTEQARFKPAEKIEITTFELSSQSTGQLFVAIRDVNPDIPNGMALRIDGKQYKIKDNEDWIQTNSIQPPAEGFTVIPFDFPMRLLEKVKKPVSFTLVFDAGVIEKEKFLKYGESVPFTVTITSDELQAPKYDQAVDGD